MIRILLVEVLLFVLPFALYGAYMIVTGKAKPGPGFWSQAPLRYLVIAGLVCVIAGLIWLATFGDADKSGTYYPAQFKDGVLTPGRIE